MAKHDVSFTLPRRSLGVADVKFLVKTDGNKVGTLAVSNGSLVWFPVGKKNGYKIGWKRFDELMRREAPWWERR